MTPMVDGPKQVFVPVPEGYYDLDEDDQESVCLQLADALIVGLGALDSHPNETPEQQGHEGLQGHDHHHGGKGSSTPTVDGHDSCQWLCRSLPVSKNRSR